MVSGIKKIDLKKFSPGTFLIKTAISKPNPTEKTMVNITHNMVLNEDFRKKGS
jgi:hypothetical protein